MEPVSLDELKESLRKYLGKRENIGCEDLKFVVSPYRISPLGAHIDHQGGPVLGMTINAYSVLAFIPNYKKRLRIYSMNYPGVAEFRLDHFKRPAKDYWGRYAIGALKIMRDFTTLEYGFTGVIAGTLPASGLSSSASVGLAYLHALANVNELDISPGDYVELDRKIENDYLGLNNGILDQSSIVYGKRNSLIYIDTLSRETSAHAIPEDCERFNVLIIYSGISRELTSSAFNVRVEQCAKAAGYLSLMGNRAPVNTLSQVPRELYLDKRDKLPEELRKRADHFFTEIERVEDGVQAWNAGEISRFGELMNESCESSLTNYESGSVELEYLQNTLRASDNVYGSRFNGGGYGGCAVAFVNDKTDEEAVFRILRAYKEKFPEAGEKALTFFVTSEDGVRIE